MTNSESADTPAAGNFDALFHGARTFLCLIAPDGTLLDVNGTCLQWTASDRDELVGQALWKANWVPGDDQREELRQAVASAAAGEPARFCMRVMGCGAASRSVDFELRPIRNDDGGVRALLCEGLDVTLADTLDQSFEALGSGAAILAHEIKNPLTSVNLALRAVARELGEGEVEVLEQLSSRLDHLEQLIRRTFACVRPVEPQIMECELHEVLKAAMKRASLTDRVDLELHGDPVVCVDPPLLETALVELLHNAQQAMQDDGRIRIVIRDGSPAVLLQIEDDGSGIPPELADRLFQPFTSSRMGRAGLGLAIARNHVELCGGRLHTLESESSAARFELQLPRA